MEVISCSNPCKMKSKEQVEGVCKLLSQNIEIIASLRFNHCKLASEFVNAICESLPVKDLPTQRIQHFTFSVPAGLKSFLSSARCLCTADFRDCDLQQNSARMIFSALFDASSNICFWTSQKTIYLAGFLISNGNFQVIYMLIQENAH
ncbi:hypothetical protein POM88_052852 [Heracleum sosnowskyi]|uniref:Uncharacterized protein n=1 Tax=Heracleum sosnowskyi TaxID=360622 RepID=A0AAD8LYN0_9APIA|nr:hypothetical protein POM88_052852 [Heracleum sosnowskyi]